MARLAAAALYDYGTVFQLSRRSDGTWSETILHSFKNGDPDGDDLNGSPVLDAAVNLYAAATSGGGPGTHGTLFELTPGPGGWTLTVLHRFVRGIAGSPQGPLTMDLAGNLYGTAKDPFELSRSSGQWKLTLLHKFPSFKGDGDGAYAGVTLDASGDVYGATEGGGTGNEGCIQTGCGIDYELHRMPDGKWKEIVLHDFGTGDDMNISGALLLDGAGNFYGTANGGAYNQGVVYRLSRGSGGHWKAVIQYSFTGGAAGSGPNDLVMDKSGNIYGTTVNGGDANCSCGVVFKLAPGSKGKWKYTVLHRFTGYDGALPVATLILDSKGNLHGTTSTRGPDGSGVAFELTP